MDWSSKSLLIFDDQVLSRDGSRFGSNESHALFLIKASRRFGRTTFVARVAPRPQLVQYPIPPHVNVCPLPFYENVAALCRGFIRYAPRIVRLLRRGLKECDVLWLVWPHPVSLLALIVLRICSRRQAVCLFVRGDYSGVVRHRYTGLRKLAALSLGVFLQGQLRLWSRRAIIFTVGDELYDTYRHTGNIVRRISCPCLAQRDLGPLEPSPPIGEEDTLQLLSVSRLEPEKGLTYLIQAVAILRRAHVRLHLDVVGEGAQEHALKAMVTAQGLGSVVTFHGYCPFGDKLAEHYRHAHLFVLPSLSEGVPKVLIEAMAFGTPVIATRVGGIPPIIQHHRNGWLVEAGSADALAAAIREAAHSTVLRESVRREAKRDVEPLLFDAQEPVIYQSLAGEPEPDSGAPFEAPRWRAS
jgi:glycosyltransferase involved in cell wall biosynthesis